MLFGNSRSVSGQISFFVARLNTDGSIDSSFGSSGTVTTVVGQPSNSGSSWGGVYIQSDGKILAISGAGTSSSSFGFAIVRYNTDGSIDSSFGSAGQVTIDIGSAAESFPAAATLQSNGSILVAGVCVGGGGTEHGCLARYTTAGVLDSSFGSGGTITTSISSGGEQLGAILIDSIGNILVGGTVSGPFVGAESFVLRYTPNGVADVTFGSAGATTFKPFSGVASLSLQSDGKVLAVGILVLSAQQPSNNQIVSARFNPDGSVDSTYGIGGQLSSNVSFGWGFYNFTGFTYQTNGEIVAAGFTASYLGATDYLVIARFAEN